MSRRSSRRGAARNRSAAASLPPNIERGLASLVEGNEDLVASMLSIDRPKKDKYNDCNDDNNKPNDGNAPLVAALSDCMRTNRLSAEALLARFFTASVLGPYCTGVLGVSGKGNEATLAARIGKKWSSSPGFETKVRVGGDDKDGDAGGRVGATKSGAAGSSSNNNDNATTDNKTKKTKKRAPSTTSGDTECVVEKTKPKTNANDKNSNNSNKKSRTTVSGGK